MNNKANDNSSVHLVIIRDHYKSIKQITEKLLKDFSEGNLDETLRIRAQLLHQIAEEKIAAEKSLNKKAMTSECQAINCEIKNLVLAISSLDRTASQVIKDSMKQVRSDLSQLYSTTQAAMAYTVQSRN